MLSLRRRRQHIVFGLLVIASGCGGTDRSGREAFLERAEAKRLVGAWDVTFILEHPLTSLRDARVMAPPISGTMAFTENRSSDISFPDFGSVTNKGAYDLDLTSFNLPMGADRRLQSAVARTAPVPAEQGSAQRSPGRDSVIIALEPGDSRLTIRLVGVLAGDSIAGAWIAEFLRTEATGRFTMRRRLAP
jgi:hypothetical protein